nr:hypothetical protein CFP56_11033 [Quercus suber]
MPPPVAVHERPFEQAAHRTQRCDGGALPCSPCMLGCTVDMVACCPRTGSAGHVRHARAAGRLTPWTSAFVRAAALLPSFSPMTEDHAVAASIRIAALVRARTQAGGEENGLQAQPAKPNDLSARHQSPPALATTALVLFFFEFGSGGRLRAKSIVIASCRYRQRGERTTERREKDSEEEGKLACESRRPRGAELVSCSQHNPHEPVRRAVGVETLPASTPHFDPWACASAWSNTSPKHCGHCTRWLQLSDCAANPCHSMVTTTSPLPVSRVRPLPSSARPLLVADNSPLRPSPDTRGALPGIPHDTRTITTANPFEEHAGPPPLRDQ